MVTRLYFHQALNGLSNLPQAEQSTLTSNKNVDAQTVNRSMNTTIGTAQQSLVLTSIASSSIQRYYFTSFVSPPLSGISSISANTWTYNFATDSTNSAANFPAGAAGSLPVRIVCYVWRPSTQLPIAGILDANSGNNYRGFANAERVQHGTFSGAAVSGVQDGDVIVFEVWFEITQGTATAYTDTFYYDGTTVNTTPAASPSNHASFLETPQNLTFTTLTRVSLSQIYKYNIRSRITQSKIYKYQLLNQVLSSRIFRYALKSRVALARIYRYNIATRLSLPRIYRYNLQARIASSRIYRYAITAQVLSSRIYRYKLQSRLSLSRIYRYGLFGRVSDSNIYKYKIFAKISLTRTYLYKIQSRISLARIYRYNLLKKIFSTRIFKYNIIGRIVNPEIYKYNILNRFSTSRIYKYNIRKKVTLARIYSYKIFKKVSLARIYKYNLLNTISNPETYRYQIAARISLSRIYRYGIIATILRASKNINYIYNIRARIATSRTFKYNILNKLALSRIYRYKIFQRVGAYHLAFDGINDYVQLGNDTSLWSQALTKFSFSFWVMQDVIAGGGADDVFVNHGNLGTFPANRFVCSNSFTGHLEFTVKNAANTSITARFSNAAVPEVWQQVVCTYDNSLGSNNVKIYVNGVLGNIMGNLTETINLAQTMQLADSNQPFQGMMKDFRWWTTIALNQPKVTALYNAGANNTDPIVNAPDYWLTMEERDSSGNPIDKISGTKTATLQNGTFWMGMYPATGRVQSYKYNLLQKLATTQTYLYKIFQKAAKTQTHLYNILQRVGFGCIQLPTTAAYINLGNDATLWSQSKTKFSFSVWVKPDALNTGAFQNILNHNWQATGSFICYFVNVGYTIVFALRDSIAQKAAQSAGSIADVGQWIHLTGVYDSTLGSANIKIYKNKVLGSTGIATEAMNQSAILTLGSSSGSTPGMIKDFRWYTTKALTQQEINDIYENTPQAPVPDYWLKMSEQTGSPTDTITGTKTGTLTTGAKWVANAPPTWTGKLSHHIYNIFERTQLARIYRYAIIGRIALLRTYVYNILQRVGRPLAIHFDGVDDSITIGSNTAIDNLDNYTIAFWIYPTASAAGTPGVFIKLYPSSNGFILYFNAGTYTLTFRTVNNAGGTADANTSYINTNGPNKWYHVLVTFNRSTGAMQVFIDKGLKVSATNTGALTNGVGGTSPILINGGGTKWAGHIKDFRLFRSVLIQSDIDKVYANDSTAPTPNYWLKMEDTPSTSTIDSINGYVASLVNGPTRILLAPAPWLAETQTYIYNIAQKVGTVIRTYRYKISGRIKLSRIFKYKILIPTLLSQTYKYKIIGRTRLPRLYSYGIKSRRTLAQSYIYNILGQVLSSLKYRYQILTEVSTPWSVAGKLTDFPSRLDGLVIDYVVQKWQISDPAMKLMPPPVDNPMINQRERVTIGNFDYDKFRSFYIRVKEQPAQIVNRVRPNLMEFNTPIEFECNVRKLKRGEAFMELQNMINELIRIFLMYRGDDVFGIQAIDFESITPLKNKETFTMHQSNKTIWTKTLRIVLHYHKVKRVEVIQ